LEGGAHREVNVAEFEVGLRLAGRVIQHVREDGQLETGVDVGRAVEQHVLYEGLRERVR
jgi:hypothetical protein